MSEQPDDGGRAFPNRGDNTPGFPYYDGMSLRDYFAAAALQGMIANSSPEAQQCTIKKAICAGAFQYADAMLAERAK